MAIDPGSEAVSRLMVSWIPFEDSTYEVYRKLNGENAFSRLGSVNENNFLDREFNLVREKSPIYQIKSIKGSSESQMSKSATLNWSDALDLDNDGYNDGHERYLGTNEYMKCGADWPPNLNNLNRSLNRVNSFDALKYIGKIGSKRGDGNFEKRLDLDANGRIDTRDFENLKKVFNKSCKI